MLQRNIKKEQIEQELIPLLDKYCRINAYEEDGSLDEVTKEISKYVYANDLFATVNWYWNTQYLKSMTNDEWIQYYLFDSEEIEV